MRYILFATLLLFVSCDKELDDPQSGDSCPHDVVCQAEGYDFTFGENYGTAYLCTVDEQGALYVPQALSSPCVADGDVCGDGTESCFVDQLCLTSCTLGDYVCNGPRILYECVEDDLCDGPHWTKPEVPPDCPE